MAKKFVKAMDSQHFGDVVEASKGKKEPDLTLFPLNEYYITYKLERIPAWKQQESGKLSLKFRCKKGLGWILREWPSFSVFNLEQTWKQAHTTFLTPTLPEYYAFNNRGQHNSSTIPKN